MWFYIKICQNQQLAFLVMCDVWYDTNNTWVGRPIQSDMRSSQGDMRYSSSPLQSDVRSCQVDVRYSYAHKFVMCGDVRFSDTPRVKKKDAIRSCRILTWKCEYVLIYRFTTLVDVLCLPLFTANENIIETRRKHTQSASDTPSLAHMFTT